jgi:hypothetical protein
MRLSSRKWKWLGAGFVAFLIAFVVVRTWVVPRLILSQLQAQYKGNVEFQDWWFGLGSSGITGLKLGETAEKDSPVWFSADRISTNVSLSRLIRGQWRPTRVEVDEPSVTFRLDAKGQPLTRIPLPESSKDKAQAKADPAGYRLEERRHHARSTRSQADENPGSRRPALACRRWRQAGGHDR